MVGTCFTLSGLYSISGPAGMKVTTMPKVLHALQTMTNHITVPPEIAAKAKLAIDRMVAIGGSTPSTPPGPGVDPGE